MSKGKVSGSLTGIGVEIRPGVNEKTSLNKGSVTNSGVGKGSAIKSASPLTATYDSRPQCHDNQMGATRPKGSK